MTRLYAFIIAVSTTALIAHGTVAVLTIQYKVANAPDSEGRFAITVRNISDEALTYSGLTIHYLQPGKHQNSWYQKDFRQNALCNCGDVCTLESMELKPAESKSFSWDSLDDSCMPADPGRYAVQLFGPCEWEGCLGSFFFGRDGEFEIN